MRSLAQGVMYLVQFLQRLSIDVPYIIHNLDASIGLANKLFVKAASVLTLGIEDLGVRPKSGRVEVTGNPISRSFSNKLDQSQTIK